MRSLRRTNSKNAIFAPSDLLRARKHSWVKSIGFRSVVTFDGGGGGGGAAFETIQIGGLLEELECRAYNVNIAH